MFASVSPQYESANVAELFSGCADACLNVLLKPNPDGVECLTKAPIEQIKASIETACAASNPSKNAYVQIAISGLKALVVADVLKRFASYVIAIVLLEKESDEYRDAFRNLDAQRRASPKDHQLWGQAASGAPLQERLRALLETRVPLVNRIHALIQPPYVFKPREERVAQSELMRLIAKSLFCVFMMTADYAAFLAEPNGVLEQPRSSFAEAYAAFIDELQSTPLSTDATKFHAKTISGNGLPLTDSEKVVAVPSTWVKDLKSLAEGTYSGTSAPSELPLWPLDLYDIQVSQVKFLDSTTSTSIFMRPALYEKLWQQFGGIRPIMEHPVDADFQVATHKATYDFILGTGAHQLKITHTMWACGTLAQAVLAALVARKPSSELELAIIDKWRRRVEKVLQDPTQRNYLHWERQYSLSYQYNDKIRTLSNGSALLIQRSSARSDRYATSSSRYSGGSSFTGIINPRHVGLSNIGNTCYMNSALQCLSNSRAFRASLRALDSSAVVGAPVTRALKDLFARMWSGEVSVVGPSEFKAAFSKRVTRFDGWEQQDSIEFVNALLDVVLEELNPVKTKSYSERNSDHDAQRTDEENSHFYWQDFCKNNQGFVFDQFYGQMRSEFTCLTCTHSACVYDAFSCVPVAIDTMDLKSLDVRVCVQAKETPLTARFRLRLPKTSCSVRDLVMELETTLKQVSTPTYSGPLKLLNGSGVEFAVTIEHMKLIEAYSSTVTMMDLDRGTQAVYFDDSTNYTVFILPELEDRMAAPSRRIKAAVAKRKAAEAAKAKAAADAASTTTASSAAAAPASPGGATAGDTTAPADGDAEKPSSAAAGEPAMTPPPPAAAPAADSDDDEVLPQVVQYTTMLLQVSDKTSGAGGHLVVHCPTNATSRQLWVEVLRTVEPFLPPTSDGTQRDISSWSLTRDTYTIPRDDDESFPIKGQYAANRATLHLSTDCRLVLDLVDDKTVTVHPPKDYVPPQRALPDLLETMTKAQELVGMDQWYCAKCKTHTDSRKKDSIYVLPNYLIIQLKRFTASADGYTMRKIETAVPFHDELDMSPYVSARLQAEGNCRYKLYGAVHHSGSLAFGHYTATALAPTKKTQSSAIANTRKATVDDINSSEDDNPPKTADAAATSSAEPSNEPPFDFDEPRVWVDYNDSSCYTSSQGPSKTSAYLLFYERIPTSSSLAKAEVAAPRHASSS